MARLGHTGSTALLRKELFPIGFAGDVMLLIYATWQELSLKEEVTMETRITAIFHKSLIRAYTASGRSWFITLEDPITDPEYGTELGRNDLRFYPPDHHGQTVFFTVECKRLRVRTKSGFKILADKYSKEGIQRFVDKQYSPDFTSAGMVGYVLDNELSKAFSAVSSEFSTNGQALRIPSKGGIRIPSGFFPEYEWSADTVHQRDGGDFQLHHLLLGVPSKPAKAPKQPRRKALHS